jgi:hypothetical protein
MLRDLCRAGVECMTNEKSPEQRLGYKEIVASILAFILALVIIGFIGKFLWNNSMAQLFTVVRPVQSPMQIIALLILLSLLR